MAVRDFGDAFTARSWNWVQQCLVVGRFSARAITESGELVGYTETPLDRKYLL